jgi:TonB family protein
MNLLRAVWLVAAIALLWALSATAWAQVDAPALEQLLKGKQFHLLNYSADPVARYRWENGGLTAPPPQARTFGIFTPATVGLKGQVLTIAGDEAALVRDTKTGNVGMAGHSRMSLVVELGTSDPAMVLPQMRDQLFFADGTAAHASLPPMIADKVPYPNTGFAPPSGCNCQRFRNDGEWVEIPRGDPGLAQPRLIYQTDPAYTPEARAAKVNGRVLLMFDVNTNGQAVDIWVLRSLGFGLDKAAVDALRKYRFTPASYKGRPVETQLVIDINFKIF